MSRLRNYLVHCPSETGFSALFTPLLPNVKLQSTTNCSSFLRDGQLPKPLVKPSFDDEQTTPIIHK